MEQRRISPAVVMILNCLDWFSGKVTAQAVRRCRVCGCTDGDCRQCVEKTGRPCHWVERDICSACADEEEGGFIYDDEYDEDEDYESSDFDDEDLDFSSDYDDEEEPYDDDD